MTVEIVDLLHLHTFINSYLVSKKGVILNVDFIDNFEKRVNMYLKNFFNKKKEFKKRDYIISKLRKRTSIKNNGPTELFNINLKEFMNNNIGEIIDSEFIDKFEKEVTKSLNKSYDLHNKIKKSDISSYENYIGMIRSASEKNAPQLALDDASRDVIANLNAKIAKNRTLNAMSEGISYGIRERPNKDLYSKSPILSKNTKLRWKPGNDGKDVLEKVKIINKSQKEEEENRRARKYYEKELKDRGELTGKDDFRRLRARGERKREYNPENLLYKNSEIDINKANEKGLKLSKEITNFDSIGKSNKVLIDELTLAEEEAERANNSKIKGGKKTLKKIKRSNKKNNKKSKKKSKKKSNTKGIFNKPLSIENTLTYNSIYTSLI